MKNKSLGLKIFIICEIVVALRILFFEIPVFINKYFVDDAIVLSSVDRFMAIVVFISIFYLLAGISTVSGNRFWRPLHYLVSILALFLTTAFYQMVQSSGETFHLFYYFPLMCSVLTTWVVISYKESSLTKDQIMKSVLIVDDDISIHKMLEPVLTNSGFKVFCAKTGEEGLQMAKDHKPDMIVLDVILPGIKGREVCKQLKSDEAVKDIPVLFLTSKDSPDDVQAEIEAGGIGHLTKPINPQYLLAQVKRVLC